MSIAPKSASEKAFQEKFVRKMEEYRWQAPDYLDGNKGQVTIDDLIINWRKELNRLNSDQLEGIALTDNEFEQVMAKVSQIANSFEAAKLLAMEEGKGKIDGIYRDPDPRITREQITLTVFKKAQVGGGDSSYKIAREVVSTNGNRFDLVLLINGLPLINIEQKRADKSLNEAFNQFKRYYGDGEYAHNFMAFSQMMVITSEVATRYFATPKCIDDFNPSFVFHWADENNQPVNHWEDVIDQFLMIPMAHQMVGDYLVIDHARDEENRRHMLLRSYQVHALRAVEQAAYQGIHGDGIPHGGFVWHTTGSGKTITSFKTALFLSTRGGFDKVVFLVDRRELDSHTSESFKAYAAYEPVEVDDTSHTYELRKRLLSSTRGIVVTTTFKLNALVKDLDEAGDNRLKDKKIVFIIDEAHRTTMGQMMGTIKNHFKKNGLFFGFTGTPLFQENRVTGMIDERSEVIDTTEKLFGPLLHQYTIDEAIADNNVLGFHVDYINTGEFASYERLRELIIEDVKEEKPDQAERDIERKVMGWSELEVEKEAVRRGLLVYHDETHIPRVVEEILRNWDKQSQDKKFNALLTVAYKKRVLAYYNEFKKQVKEKGIDLNVAMTFSFGGDDEEEPMDPAIIEGMFKDYAAFTGIEFAMGDSRRGENAYYEDLTARAKRGGSGRNPRNIDLVIVADQMLTGYDSRFLNTLYVDRPLELQGLIQAYSRTNRIYGKEKEFGSVINFQYPRITEEQVNKALKLYGSGGTSSKAIVDPYDTSVVKLKKTINEMVQALPIATEWQLLEANEEGKEAFVSAFKAATEQLNFVEQYYQYEWNDESFGLSHHDWLHYVGAYRNLTREDTKTPDDIAPNVLVGKTKLAGSQKIDAGHILNLIGSKATTSGGKQTVDAESLRILLQQIQELSNMGEYEEAELLKEFVNEELKPGNIDSGVNFDDAFEAWKKEKRRKYIYDIAQNWGLDSALLERAIDAYSLAHPDDIPFVDELIGSVDFSSVKEKKASSQLEHNMMLNEYLDEVIPKIKVRYK